ncbi:MAG: type II secretion system minor pseudopilin GspK [Deltaproteobacteria bacterium]|nr:MAG: type II secretion system minor pseudopilin GspK [Deltaproteobacteria bacterium]
MNLSWQLFCKRAKLIEDQKGIALILVLVVIALLVSLVVDFSYTMRVDLTLAANLRDEIKALYTARSGTEVARLMLKEDDPVYDSLDEDWAQFTEHPGFISQDDEGRFKGTIEDEASKMAINELVTEAGEVDEDRLKQLTRLFQLLELDLDLIDPILDWLDSDDRPRPLGAEDEYYQGLSPPYPCKDSPLSAVEELLLVKGMTEDIFYGDEEKKGLVHYLTTFSEGKVNINTAPSLVLQTLSDSIDEGLAQALIDYRQEEPFKTIEEVNNVPGVTAEIYSEINPVITVQSSTFSLRVEGQVRGIKKGIFMVLNRQGEEVRPIFWRAE